MPLGAWRINGLAKRLAAAAPARTAVTIIAEGNAQIDTAQSKFGGSSALFDGTDDALQIDDSTTFNFIDTDAFTIEAFVRRASGGDTFQHIFSNNWSSASNATRGWAFLQTNGSLRFFWNPGFGGDQSITASTTTLTIGTFFHVAVCHDGSGGLKLFIDGNEEVSTTGATLNSGATGDKPRIGSTASNITAGNFSGHIDELRVSDTNRYTGNFSAPTAAFTNDANTLLLLHMDGSDASTTFTDDNGA